MLPKIHKDNPPGRPIISGNGFVAEPISKYIDFFLKTFVTEMPSYIQDTTQVLKKISTMKVTALWLQWMWNLFTAI